MKHNVTTTWKGNMKFDSLVSGHHLIMDAAVDGGGEDQGPRPKELMLTALAGCTGMDVVSLLKKMRVEVEKFDLHVEAEVTEEHPKHYTGMHIVYEFTGKDLPLDMLEKAIKLSQEKYCGVSYMYKKAMDITWEIKVIPTK
ncbi:MAG: OsmC family protein [Bacteroidota bacterium]|nr:OsmC family protein [Bacteroidota bacterium]